MFFEEFKWKGINLVTDLYSEAAGNILPWQQMKSEAKLSNVYV